MTLLKNDSDYLSHSANEVVLLNSSTCTSHADSISCWSGRVRYAGFRARIVHGFTASSKLVDLLLQVFHAMTQCKCIP